MKNGKSENINEINCNIALKKHFEGVVEKLKQEKKRSSKKTTKIIDQFIRFLHEEKGKSANEISNEALYLTWTQRVKDSIFQDAMKMRFNLCIVQLNNLRKLNSDILFMAKLTKWISKNFLKRYQANLQKLLQKHKEIGEGLISNIKEISKLKLEKNTISELTQILVWLSTEFEKLPKDRFKSRLYKQQLKKIYFYLFSEVNPIYLSLFEKFKLYWLKSLSDFN